MGALTLCITGAVGFLGQATVAEARARDHTVLAVLRRASQAPEQWARDPGISVIEGDLSLPAPALKKVVSQADALLHLAARLSGDDTQMQADTLAPTRALLALSPRLVVLASSLSVYGATALKPHAALDETCGLEPVPQRRDAYCRAKLAQEGLVRTMATSAWVLRIGALYGEGRFWNAHLGQRLGPLVVGPSSGDVPLCHVRTAATALISAAERQPHGIEAVNILDDRLPSRKTFIAALKSRGDVSFHLPLAWGLPHIAAAMTGDRGPGLLRRPVIAARLKPLTYPNRRMQERLGPLDTADWRIVMEEGR